MKPVLSIATLALCVLLPQSGLAEPVAQTPNAVVTQTDFAAELSVRLRAMKSLQAQFQQRVLDEAGLELQSASGVLKMKQPRKLYWQTLQPYEHLVVTNGRDMWMVDTDLEQASRQDFNDDLARTPALLLSGEAELIASNYRVSAVDQGELRHYLLEPIDKGGLFSSLEIHFRGEQLVAMRFVDSFDQTTDIRFSQLQPNVSLPDSDFDYQPSADFDVLDNDR